MRRATEPSLAAVQLGDILALSEPVDRYFAVEREERELFLVPYQQTLRAHPVQPRTTKVLGMKMASASFFLLLLAIEDWKRRSKRRIA
jgi:hypothetical protein